MKKIVFILILGSLSLLMACGNKSSETSFDANGNDKQSATGNSGKTQNGDFVPLEPFKKDATIEETVLFDKNDLKITAISLTYGNYSADLGLKFENNSDKNMSFIAQSLGYSRNAINDSMIKDGYVNVDVAAGESATDTMRFNYNEMMLSGISEIGIIQTGFSISDDDYNDIYTGTLELKTTAADTVESSTNNFRKNMQSKALQYTYNMTLDYFSDEELYSSAGISIITEVLITNKDGKQTLMIEEKNDTEMDARISIKDIKINDQLAYEGTWSSEIVTAGKRTIEDIGINSVLKEEKKSELGIEDVESIGFTIEAKNSDNMVMSEPAEVIVKIR
ncbi:hypothetical protein BXO88_05550 [Oribacterium sp. C9]|uniref:hypothetical protein n=1 Tax=Oribacterium sp. C9 TaxID=1943579 RepID=UPI00098EC0B7|nr:hypothetical protein [Oribacterium sp. C9]OON87005.1 hypothetical protein BXO88_05550 [Oribacterium sp. C9]